MIGMARSFALAAVTGLAVLGSVAGAEAGSIVLLSNASTEVTALDAGDGRLTTGDITGLTWTNATEGAFGTWTGVPPGAPAGAEVINIGAGVGAYGFYKDVFTLPFGFSAASIAGLANIDDDGYVFLNGHNIGYANEFGNNAFSASDPPFFKPGLNTLVFSDFNGGGGPSGAAFFATVDYTAPSVPEPGTWMMVLAGFGLLGWSLRRRSVAAFA